MHEGWYAINQRNLTKPNQVQILLRTYPLLFLIDALSNCCRLTAQVS